MFQTSPHGFELATRLGVLGIVSFPVLFIFSERKQFRRRLLFGSLDSYWRGSMFDWSSLYIGTALT